MASFEIHREPINCLEDLSRIPTAFEVRSVFDVLRQEQGVIELGERWLEAAYQKDYDAIPDNRPVDWADQFDLSNWCLLSARNAERWVGGLLIAWKTTGIEMLENREDLAVLWDLRVHPDERRHGVATALVDAAEVWAKSQGCRDVKVESQNINVPACRFYSRRGFRLAAIHPGAYSDFPDEIQFLWSKNLIGTGAIG